MIDLAPRSYATTYSVPGAQTDFSFITIRLSGAVLKAAGLLGAARGVQCVRRVHRNGDCLLCFAVGTLRHLAYAGHMVPTFTPEAALTFFKRFIKGTPF